MLAVTGFRAESRPGGEVRFSWDRHPFDNDTGVSDTIVFRLDNNYPPVVKIDSVFGIKRVTGSY